MKALQALPMGARSFTTIVFSAAFDVRSLKMFSTSCSIEIALAAVVWSFVFIHLKVFFSLPHGHSNG